MASAAASKKLLLADDVPWRQSPAGAKPLPRIHQNPILKLPQNPNSSYALAIMKRADPIGEGFATEATLEAAGPECIVPGQVSPVKILGLKVWPIEIDLKFLEPVGRELKSVGKMVGVKQSPTFEVISIREVIFFGHKWTYEELASPITGHSPEGALENCGFVANSDSNLKPTTSFSSKEKMKLLQKLSSFPSSRSQPKSENTVSIGLVAQKGNFSMALNSRADKSNPG